MAADWIRGKLLGAGSFGSVNLAVKRESGEVFAVKSVPANTPSALRALENEISLLQGLNSSSSSEHVIRCYGSDWTVEDGVTFRNAYLEYMPGGNLTDFVKQFASASFDEQLLRTYTRGIVEAIAYLHSQGIVHCDIKGKNVLVGSGGKVKLTDLGSSKRVGEGGAMMAGTPLWMAPEVIWQEEQGFASDIWSLGCTVVEMATGRAPWSQIANQFAALYHIACTEEIPELPPSLSAEAKDFLSHCFQRNPAKRWTSAQLLLHPFLTNRFATPLVISSSDVEFSEPSLLKRGLISPVLQENSVTSNWSMPDNSPWIVVRSPKSASPPSSIANSKLDSFDSYFEQFSVSQKQQLIHNQEQCADTAMASSTSLEVSIPDDDVSCGIGGSVVSEADYSNRLGIHDCYYHVEDDYIARKLEEKRKLHENHVYNSCLIPLDMCSGGICCLRSCTFLYKNKIAASSKTLFAFCVFCKVLFFLKHLRMSEHWKQIRQKPFDFPKKCHFFLCVVTNLTHEHFQWFKIGIKSNIFVTTQSIMESHVLTLWHHFS